MAADDSMENEKQSAQWLNERVKEGGVTADEGPGVKCLQLLSGMRIETAKQANQFFHPGALRREICDWFAHNQLDVFLAQRREDQIE